MASTEEKPTNGKPKQKAKPDKKPKCGIVMPIAEMDGYSAQHWSDVKEIISEVAESAGMDVNLVSYTDETTVIHKTIIQNLFSNEIVVCDVSGKNPNVMFELGIRLTFDKPTVVIIDDTTKYTFDIGIIEHLTYPRDLHYQTIVVFKEKLKSKILATLEKFEKDPSNASFLKHFGVHTVTGLETTELSPDKFIVEKLNELVTEVRSLKTEQSNKLRSNRGSRMIRFTIAKESRELLESIVMKDMNSYAWAIDWFTLPDDRLQARIFLNDSTSPQLATDFVKYLSQTNIPLSKIEAVDF